MGSTLLRNATVLSMDAERRIFENGDVLIKDDRIAAVGVVEPQDADAADEVLDMAGRIVLPGLVNTHVHTSQQLERGLADDVDLLTWLHDRTWPFESALSEEDQYLSTLACGCELIRSGVTTFGEAGGQHVDATGRAVEELGLRANLCLSSMDCGEGLPDGWVRPTQEVLAEQKGLYDRWHGKADGRINMWFGLRTIFNCSDELIVATKDMADTLNTGVHMHVAEILEEVRFAEQTRGATTVEHLASLGALGANLLAVHHVWLTPKEVDLLALHNVKTSHNAAAAMRYLGFAPVPEMLRKGISVSIGTDGAPSNNHMDMMSEMYLVSLIHKGRHLDPYAVTAERVLEMATVMGAQCMLMEESIGSLSAGMKADLIVVNPCDFGTLPVHDPVSAMVGAMYSANVESSMCDGRWLMRDRKVLTVDMESVLGEIQSRADTVRKRAGIQLPPRFPVTKVR
ncbi:amidohydrolase [Oleidesulfovibrio sp.]|uniref:amidohydrolase n=1 Tax=Oleidesulfovibrio sp. TaxID=2909707 RepID=UPI003A83739B